MDGFENDLVVQVGEVSFHLHKVPCFLSVSHFLSLQCSVHFVVLVLSMH
jgi:hypothetical protein